MLVETGAALASGTGSSLAQPVTNKVITMATSVQPVKTERLDIGLLLREIPWENAMS
jgi:hypothetical protein